jgi:hypothetical protein
MLRLAPAPPTILSCKASTTSPAPWHSCAVAQSPRRQLYQLLQQSEHRAGLTDPSSGNDPDRGDLQKHGGRAVSASPPATGSAADKNRQG